jgi:uncharacterized membrane protein
LTLRLVVLGIHIAAGSVGILAAPVAMLTAKGGKVHRFAGKVFYRCMAVVALSAATLVLFFGASAFLLFVAVLSFNFAFRGVRALARKRPQRDPATLIDWVGALLALTAGVGFFAVPFLPAGSFDIGGQAHAHAHAAMRGSGYATVAYVFGAMLVFMAARQIGSFLHPPADRNAWWFTHMAGMLGAYIAFVTAFSALNFAFLPTAVRWLWPTVVGTPGIFLWIRFYRRKFGREDPDQETDSRAPSPASAS